MAKVYCKLNLRPRINGVPTLIEAGESFDESVLDAHSVSELRRQGYLLDDGDFEMVEEAPAEEAPAIKGVQGEVTTYSETAEVTEEALESLEGSEEAPEEEEAPAEEAPKPKPEGVWNLKREQIQDMDLDVLNAMGKKIANEHGQNFRAFQNKDSLLDKLCSEAAED